MWSLGLGCRKQPKHGWCPELFVWAVAVLVGLGLTTLAIRRVVPHREAVSFASNTAQGCGNQSLLHTANGDANRSHLCQVPPPLPSTNKVSIVIMNWKRPGQVQQIVNEILNYTAVDEIIIWHCRNDTSFRSNHTKVRTFMADPNANEIWGLATRFKGCQMAQNPWVLLLDDDYIIAESLLEDWLQEKRLFPDRLYGLIGRTWPDGQPSYQVNGPNADLSRGTVAKIALTNILLTDRRFCSAFFDFAPLVEDYVREHSVPFWNGEDIFHSLTAYKVTGNWHMSMQPEKDVYRRDIKLLGHSHAISLRPLKKGFNHLHYRNGFLREAIKRLQIE